MITNGLPAFYPGEYLAEILEELHLSQVQFAHTFATNVPRIVNRSLP